MIAKTESNAVLEMFDLMGRKLVSEKLLDNNGKTTIDTSNYPSGIYLVVVKSNDTVISQHKLIIK